MTSIPRSIFTVAAAAALLATGVATSNGARGLDAVALPASAAELEFADADMGVDPMVTGPTTAAFRQQQEAFGCATAVWPDVPTACYPKR